MRQVYEIVFHTDFTYNSGLISPPPIVISHHEALPKQLNVAIYMQPSKVLPI